MLSVIAKIAALSVIATLMHLAKIAVIAVIAVIAPLSMIANENQRLAAIHHRGQISNLHYMRGVEEGGTLHLPFMRQPPSDEHCGSCCS